METILVVDDHEDIRTLLSITLEGDYRVLEAADGEEALRVAKKEKPVAVLLDVMMPGELDGLQVLNAIKTDPALAHILVGMVTARGQEGDLALGERYGADGYFVKPFSPLQILTWLRRRTHSSADLDQGALNHSNGAANGSLLP